MAHTQCRSGNANCFTRTMIKGMKEKLIQNVHKPFQTLTTIRDDFVATLCCKWTHALSHHPVANPRLGSKARLFFAQKRRRRRREATSQANDPLAVQEATEVRMTSLYCLPATDAKRAPMMRVMVVAVWISLLDVVTDRAASVEREVYLRYLQP